jgi:hypothetical protein
VQAKKLEQLPRLRANPDAGTPTGCSPMHMAYRQGQIHALPCATAWVSDAVLDMARSSSGAGNRTISY